MRLAVGCKSYVRPVHWATRPPAQRPMNDLLMRALAEALGEPAAQFADALSPSRATWVEALAEALLEHAEVSRSLVLRLGRAAYFLQQSWRVRR